MAYIPGDPPLGDAESLSQFLREELKSIAQQLGAALEIDLRERNAEPSKPREGMLVFADGTNWNPGDGKGLYAFEVSAWEAMMLGRRNLSEVDDPAAAADNIAALKTSGGTLSGNLTISSGGLDVTGNVTVTAGDFTVDKAGGVTKLRSGDAATTYNMQMIGRQTVDANLVLLDFFNIEHNEVDPVFSIEVRRSGAHNVAEVRFLWEGVLGHTFRSSGALGLAGPVELPSYTVAGVPAASPAGQMIFVSDETGGAVPAFSDGTDWRRVTDRAIVS